MIITDLLGWWYVHGWSWSARQIFVVRSEKISHFFSLSELLKTLFAPFRQDALETRGAPLGIKLQAFGGNIISRIFGLIIRSTLLLVGLVTLTLNFAMGICAVLLWPLLPLSPFVAIILISMGVGA